MKRKVFWLCLRGTCEIYNEENLLIKFYYCSYFWFEKLKILYQNLERKVSLNRKGFKYILEVDRNNISIKYNANVFSKKTCKIFFNENCVCEIKTEIVASKTNYIFDFIAGFEYSYEVMIFFSINNVGIEDSV